MEICPKCEKVIRNGEFVFALIKGEFFRVDVDKHGLRVYDYVWTEHMNCVPETIWIKLRKWIGRKYGLWIGKRSI